MPPKKTNPPVAPPLNREASLYLRFDFDLTPEERVVLAKRLINAVRKTTGAMFVKSDLYDMCFKSNLVSALCSGSTGSMRASG